MLLRFKYTLTPLFLFQEIELYNIGRTAYTIHMFQYYYAYQYSIRNHGRPQKFVQGGARL